MRECLICNKRTETGNTVSHANNRHRTRNLPNLKNVRVQLSSGAAKRIKICTRCLRSGKVQKAA